MLPLTGRSERRNQQREAGEKIAAPVAGRGGSSGFGGLGDGGGGVLVAETGP